MSEDIIRSTITNVEPQFVPGPRMFVGSTGTTTFRRSGGGYEEFFGGQVVCPTCNGAGRIPRETDQEVMALIPITDKRLKPRRTLLYVLLAIVLCSIIGGLLLFFFFPRSVNLNNVQPTLSPSYIYNNLTEGMLLMTVVNEYNITNHNFFDVAVTALDVTMNYGTRIIGQDVNASHLTVPLRSSMPHYIKMNATFTFDEEFIVQACSSLPHMVVLIPFHATLTLEYLGKSEQNTLVTYQYVRCNLNSQ